MGKVLNNQEQVFFDEYLISLNPEKAAKKAKYADTTAHSKAYLWVSNSKNNPKPYIYQAIQKKMATRSKKASITAQMVVDELARLGFSNIQDFLGKNNKIKDISKLNRDITAAVEVIQVDKKTGKVKLKLHDKKGALTDLGKHLGIYERDNRQTAQTLVDFLKAMKDG